MLREVRIRGSQVTMVRVFVSSGDDVRTNRNYIDRLVGDAVNVALGRLHVPVRFEVDRWERSAPHKILPGATTNEEFVARAQASHLVVGVLQDTLGEGTREELEAVLTEDEIELAVVWCERHGDRPTTPVSEWLKRQREDIVYDRAGRLGTDGPRIALTRLFMQAMLTAVREHAPADLWTEVRP